MATRSNIGYKDRISGLILFVYCHNDGEKLGNQLVKNYPKYEDAVKLVSKGDMSELGLHYTDLDFHQLKPEIVEDMEDIFQQEYAYIFTEDGWLGTNSNGEFVKI